MKRYILIMVVLFGPLLHAQEKVSQQFTVGGLLTYICEAPMQVPATSVTIGSGLTNIVVATNVGTVTATAHNLWTGARVVVSGSTTAALNAIYTVTVTGANTYTIVTSGVSDGTYNNAAMAITTTAPLLNAQRWRVTVLHYTSSVLDGVYLGGGGISIAYQARCSDRATY